MKTVIQSKKGLRTTLSIIVDKKSIEKKLEERLSEIQKEVSLKGFRVGKVQKKVKTDEWIEWIERASLWKRWAQRLSRLGLYTFACDAYVRYMSCLRRDRICLTPEEHVEIADVAHVTPVHVLSSNLLFRTW